MPKIQTKWQRFDELTTDKLYELLRFRQNVVEQHSPYPDLDDLDQSAWHLVARLESELAGYLRLMPMRSSPPLVRIGRVAVAAHLRRLGVGRVLTEEALLFSCRHYAGRWIVLSAQLRLVPFYERFGFAPTSEPFDDFGISHIEMVRAPDSTERPGL